MSTNATSGFLHNTFCILTLSIYHKFPETFVIFYQSKRRPQAEGTDGLLRPSSPFRRTFEVHYGGPSCDHFYSKRGLLIDYAAHWRISPGRAAVSASDDHLQIVDELVLPLNHASTWTPTLLLANRYPAFIIRDLLPALFVRRHKMLQVLIIRPPNLIATASERAYCRTNRCYPYLTCLYRQEVNGIQRPFLLHIFREPNLDKMVYY